MIIGQSLELWFLISGPGSGLHWNYVPSFKPDISKFRVSPSATVARKGSEQLVPLIWGPYFFDL